MPKINKGLIQFISYSIVGGMNFLIDLGIINLLMFSFNTYQGPKLIIFNALSFVVYSTNGYFMNKKLTFKADGAKRSSYLKYISVLFIAMCFNSIIFMELTNFNFLFLNPKLWANISKITASITTGIGSFLMNKFFVFKVKEAI